jgi:putative Mg2+ transporter-C (MgtC) family protein
MSALLNPLNWQNIAFRLSIALISGAIIGLERELKHKPAGLRTHMLVCLGSTLFILVPIQLGIAQESAEAFSRILQGIITGIGFVGGGVILRDSRRNYGYGVSGLTTAVSIWITCALGIAIGSGLWELGLVGAIVSLLTLTVFKQFEKNE